jgi:hypothetical protein
MATTKKQAAAKPARRKPAQAAEEAPRPVEFIAVQQRRERVRSALRKFH